MLTTARLTLSPLNPDDAAFYYELQDDRTEADLASDAPWPPPFLTEAMGKFGTVRAGLPMQGQGGDVVVQQAGDDVVVVQ